MTGRLAEAVEDALAARAIQEEAQLADEWVTAIVPTVLPRVYTFLEDYDAVQRETAVILATPGLAEPIRQVLVPSARALAWFESGHLAQAATSATAAQAAALRLGFGQHFSPGITCAPWPGWRWSGGTWTVRSSS
jgi:hypothetical protein